MPIGPAEMRVVHRIGERLDKIIRRVEYLETRLELLAGDKGEDTTFIDQIIKKRKVKIHAKSR